MPKIKGSSYWPCPVYVATFSDGTQCRMSVWSRQGKPLDFERGRKICCSAIGTDRSTASLRLDRSGDWHPDELRGRAHPADDLVAGHFEHDGLLVPDPYFQAPDAAKPMVSKMDRLIASVKKLSGAELLQLIAAVEAAFETAE